MTARGYEKLVCPKKMHRFGIGGGKINRATE